MPNRIIKESIRTSKSVNQMTDFQFRVWTYLITFVDDYGRGSADPELIKGFVFPRRKGVTEATIEKTLAELATIGSILLYEVDGESYLCFPNWSEHQTVRNKVSKFPAPEDGKITLASKCKQMQANVPVIQSNPIQSEYRIQNPNTESEYSGYNTRARKSARREPTEEMHKEYKAYGEHNNVMLEEGAYSLLLDEHSSAGKAIEFLSRYIERTGNEISSCYLALNSFVIPAFENQADLGNDGDKVDFAQLESTLEHLYGKDKDA